MLVGRDADLSVWPGSADRCGWVGWNRVDLI